MKTYKHILSLMTMSLLTLATLSGCVEDDEFIADELQGRWVGQLSEYYYDRFDWTVSQRDYSTQFEFYRGDRYGGRGMEVDYSRYDYRTYNFNWYVNYGNIYIEYSDGTTLEIDGYRITNNRLYGQTPDGKIEVRLTRDDYYNGFKWDENYYR